MHQTIGHTVRYWKPIHYPEHLLFYVSHCNASVEFLGKYMGNVGVFRSLAGNIDNEWGSPFKGTTENVGRTQRDALLAVET